jgi:hypothetical protein
MPILQTNNEIVAIEESVSFVLMPAQWWVDLQCNPEGYPDFEQTESWYDLEQRQKIEEDIDWFKEYGDKEEKK